MKTTILFIFSLISLTFQSAFSQDSIPNGNLEAWYNPNSAISWQTTNDLLPVGFINCFQTSNSHSGSWAMQMKTIDMNGFVVPAVLTLGNVGMGYTNGGIAFTNRPVALHLYLRHPSAGDEVFVAVQFFTAGEVIGGNSWSTTDSIADYTEIVIPISYNNELLPDTMNITLLTDPYTIGSMMQIDDFEFEYTISANREIESIETACFYPNPCADKLYLKTNQNTPIILDILNTNGQLVKHKQQLLSGQFIDLSDLPTGMFIVQYFQNGQWFRNKIIKQ